MIPGKQYSAEDVLSLIQARKWLIVGCTVLGALAAYGGSWLVANRYQSETLILVVPQRVPDDYVRSTVTSRIEDRLRSISQQILSRVSLEQIIADYKLYPSLRNRPMDYLVEQMRADIKVDLVKGDSFRVSYTSEDPRIAMEVTERLASSFIDQNLRDRELVAQDTTGFLTRELNDAKARLQAQEKKLEEYRRAHEGELPTQLSANQQALQNTRMELRASSEGLSHARDRRDLLESEVADLSAEHSAAAPAAPSEPDPVAVLQQQVDAARARFAEVSARYTPDHPDWRAASRKVKDLEGDLARAIAAAPAQPAQPRPTSAAVITRQNRVRQLRLDIESLNRQIAAYQADEQRLRGTEAQLQRRLDATPSRETELVSLTRDYETIKELYTSLLARNENSKIAESLERQKIGEQFKILDPARVPADPVWPNRTRIAGLGAVAGLFLSIGLIALAEVRDVRLRTEDDVAMCTGLPVIAVIPTLDREVAAPGQGRVKRLIGSITGAALLVGAVITWMR